MAHRQPSGGGTTVSDGFGIVDDFSEEEHDLFVRSGKMNMEHGMEHEPQNKPVYLLEHLATFTVNKDAGIEFPADGMRRLLQLEKTTGIWSQKMQLCLDNQWVLIIDFETGNVIERFPATLVKEPTAFTSLDSMELYNNILVFIVSNSNNSRSEMHIFQSQSVSAVDLVEDLKALRAGKSIIPKRNFNKQMHSGKLGGEAINTDAIMERSSFRSQNAVNNNKINILPKFSPTEEYGYNRGDVATRGNAGDTDSEHGINEETCSISSDKYERDVAVLNHCFDDIEKFIARLQHAAAASRELERRRRNRKSKKKDPGEGLLTLRTRPPHEKEFTDIFAKFKLSFNLLAKLKAHIHDPNAPELVHFLFTPLALIVEAASDTYFESQIPSRVVNPLLTREAINLLINCVTSKETELWRSLGETWTIPRDQWKEDIGSYHPVFLDGWSPEYVVVDENEVSKTSNKLNTNDKSLRRNFDNSRKYQSHDKEEIIGSGNDFSNRSELSFDSIDRNLYSSNNLMIDNDTVEIPSASGQIHIQSLNSEMQNMHIRDEKLQSTHAGVNKISHSEFASRAHTVDSWLDELQLNGAKVVQVTYPRTANNDKELTVIRGEYLEILDDSRKWWKARNINGLIGHVPHTIVTSQFYGSESSNNQIQNHENKKRQSNSLVMNEPNSEKTDVKNKYIGKKGEFRYI